MTEVMTERRGEFIKTESISFDELTEKARKIQEKCRDYTVKKAERRALCKKFLHRIS